MKDKLRGERRREIAQKKRPLTVWLVFNCEGYEDPEVMGVFSTPAAAETYAIKVRANNARLFAGLGLDDRFTDRSEVVVSSWEVDTTREFGEGKWDLNAP